MVKRSTRNSSSVFKSVLSRAEKRLLIDAASAEGFEHNGLRGAERAAALSDFLRSHLPGVFSVGKGEVIDYRDNRSGEIDLFIYDQASAAPIQDSQENMLIPAEALYAVIEVKSVLSQEGLNTCIKAAKRIRDLRPFKNHFIAPPLNGAVMNDRCRCPYYVFSYRTNLGADNWANREFDRVKEAASDAGYTLDLLDRIIVLDRGIIRPQVGTALLKESSAGLFLEFYIHLINFLMREKRRREAIDWQAYASRSTWIKLK